MVDLKNDVGLRSGDNALVAHRFAAMCHDRLEVELSDHQSATTGPVLQNAIVKLIALLELEVVSGNAADNRYLAVFLDTLEQLTDIGPEIGE